MADKPPTGRAAYINHMREKTKDPVWVAAEEKRKAEEAKRKAEEAKADE